MPDYTDQRGLLKNIENLEAVIDNQTQHIFELSMKFDRAFKSLTQKQRDYLLAEWAENK